jgi:FkbM family methyltransferase
MRVGTVLVRRLRKIGILRSDLGTKLRQWLLLLWDHISGRFDRLSDQITAGFGALSDQVYDGADFDIRKLTDRRQRWSNIAQIRRSAAAVSLGNGNVVCRTLGKYRQYVIGRDIGFSPYVMLDGFWEYHVTEFVTRNVAGGMRVMDIGANFGYYTLLMADLIGTNGKVYAFEPNPTVAAMLEYSLRVNNFTSRAVIDRRAIWSSSANVMNFSIPEISLTNASVTGPIGETVSSADFTNLPVETVALDDLPYDSIDFVKADIEGAEEKLWYGGKKFFARHPNVLCLLEFNCARCLSARATLEDISRFFRLRYLDQESYVRDVTIDQMLASEFDWLLVLSRRENID